MHIALFSPSWPPTVAANGIVTYVDQMRTALHALGHHVSIVAVRATKEDGVYPVEASRLTAIRGRLALAAGRQKAFTVGPAIADTLRALHRRRPIDVIEMEESFGWPSDVARLGIPTVVKLHGPAFLSLVEEELTHAIAAPKILAEGKALNEMQFITAPARSTLSDTISKYGIAGTTEYVPNPIDPASCAVWRCEDADPNVVLFVGRFDKRKGADRVLEAFKRVLHTNAAARLVFVGPDKGLTQPDGSLMHFADFARSLFTDDELLHVDYRGPLTPSEVASLRLRARVTIVASRWENASYTVTEAMSQGCPVAAIECDGVNEVVLRDKTGLISATSATLADDILALMNDAQRATTLGRAARQFIFDTHAPAVAVSAALRVYECAIAHGRLQPAP